MKRALFFLVIILLLGSSQTTTQAQSYKTAVGGRIGPAYGFTIKHFFTPKMAFEGLVTTRYFGGFRGIPGAGGYGHWNSTPGVNVTALVEWHFPIGKIEGFNWFIGGGLHVGVWGGYNGHPWFNNNRPYFMMGLDAIGGVEYTFAKIPLTLQADYKPSFHFFEYLGVWYDGFAVSARYTF